MLDSTYEDADNSGGGARSPIVHDTVGAQSTTPERAFIAGSPEPTSSDEGSQAPQLRRHHNMERHSGESMSPVERSTSRSNGSKHDASKTQLFVCPHPSCNKVSMKRRDHQRHMAAVHNEGVVWFCCKTPGCGFHAKRRDYFQRHNKQTGHNQAPMILEEEKFNRMVQSLFASVRYNVRLKTDYRRWRELKFEEGHMQSYPRGSRSSGTYLRSSTTYVGASISEHGDNDHHPLMDRESRNDYWGGAHSAFEIPQHRQQGSAVSMDRQQRQYDRGSNYHDDVGAEVPPPGRRGAGAFMSFDRLGIGHIPSSRNGSVQYPWI